MTLNVLNSEFGGIKERTIYVDDLIFYQKFQSFPQFFSLIQGFQGFQGIVAFPNICTCQIYSIAQTNFYILEGTKAAASLGQISEKPLGQHFVAL